MKLADYAQVLLALVSVAAIVVVGRSNIKKQIISDLQALVLAHEQTINRLKLENLQLQQDMAEKDGRIQALEETVDGYSELVREGYLAGFSGARGRNRTTSP